jgi:hypothetical protein
LQSLDVVSEHVLDDIAHFLLQAFRDTLAERGLGYIGRRDRDRLAKPFVMLDVGEADFAVELETAVQRRNAFTC